MADAQPRRSAVLDVGIDDRPYVVHVVVGDGPFSYCGRNLKAGGYLPPEEVTEPSWCPDCVRIQGGL